MVLANKRVLLIISGGIAAYKSLEIIRLLRREGASLRCVLTQGGAEFVTPLSVAALCEHKVYRDLFDLTDEAEMGHIRLSREADLILVAPASADLLAKMTAGLADDLASTLLLATDTPVMIVPAMNNRMWLHPATHRNIQQLHEWGIVQIGPEIGDMACGEYGPGRMAEPADIVAAITLFFTQKTKSLIGLRALITSGPTREPLDPVRYLSNHSSGKQGHAIAAALAAMGAETLLVSGPVALSDPCDVQTYHVETAHEMLAACQDRLPVDILVCAAAVADWRPVDRVSNKLKKSGHPPALMMVENPDILALLAQEGPQRPSLVIGFAAETERLIEHAEAKRLRKNCDWIMANDVSEENNIFGSDQNRLWFINGQTSPEAWPTLSKKAAAQKLAARIADFFSDHKEEIPSTR